MTLALKLDKASGIFFFSGFLISKLQYIPFPLLSCIFRFISLSFFFFAYGFWCIANILRPDQREHQDKWYGFAQIKEQFLFSSFIGLVATIVSVAAVFIPMLLPVAAWLFVLGNIIWAIGEYHKFKTPPEHDTNFSLKQQKSFVSYAISSTVITLITAIAATLMFVFPLFAIPITLLSLLTCVGVGALSFEFWLKSRFGGHQQTPNAGSYQQMTHALGPSFASEPTDSVKPTHSNPFLDQLKPNKTTTRDRSQEEIEMVVLGRNLSYNCL